MRSSFCFSVVGLSLIGCGSEPPPPPQYWAPPPPVQRPAPPSYGMPWAVPIPPAARALPAPVTTAAPVADALPREHDACLSEAGTANECKAALEKLAMSPTHQDRVHDIYKRACEKKAKLLGCGVFKSTAVTEADKPAMVLLMACEGGRGEACEDVKTKTAPLVAWLSTLKTDGCKKGNTALCANYRACKKSAPWGCEAIGPEATQVCGCMPQCSSGKPVAIVTGRTWPDGSKRAVFTCSSP